jgi:hypothetical protein
MRTAIVFCVAVLFFAPARSGPCVLAAVPLKKLDDGSDLENILAEINAIVPAYRLGPYQVDELPAFSRDALRDYLKTPADLAQVRASGAKARKDAPLQWGVVAMGSAITRHPQAWPHVLSAPAGPQLKAQVRDIQADVGQTTFMLEKLQAELSELDAQRAQEKNPRWRAHFDLAQARLVASVLHLYEYNFALGLVRRDGLPALAEGQAGWELMAAGRLRSTDVRVKDLARQLERRWQAIQRDYPGTPWAAVAALEQQALLGLEWRPQGRK